jgi:DNA repair exonuclease SbcCD nuclease subunit
MRFIHLSDLHLGRPLNAQKFFQKKTIKNVYLKLKKRFIRY